MSVIEISILVKDGEIRNAIVYTIEPDPTRRMDMVCNIEILVYSSLFVRVPLEALTKPMLARYVSDNPCISNNLEVRRVVKLLSLVL